MVKKPVVETFKLILGAQPPPPQGKKHAQDWLLAKLLQYLKRRYEEGKSGKKTYVPTMHVAMTQDWMFCPKFFFGGKNQVGHLVLGEKHPRKRTNVL